MAHQKRLSKPERRALTRLLGQVSANLLKLFDGASPQELADATESVIELADTYHRAVTTLEDVPEGES